MTRNTTGSAGADGVALRAARACALAILDAALDPVITIDHTGLVLEFNNAAVETFGYSRDAVLGNELAELIVPPDLREAHRAALARWTAEGPTDGAGGLLGRRIEVQAMRSDGSLFPRGARGLPRGRPRASAVHRLHPGHQRAAGDREAAP